MLASIKGVDFAMTKLKSHWVIRAAAMIRERTSLGWRRREVGLVKGVSRNFLQLLKEEGGGGGVSFAKGSEGKIE